MPDLDLGDLAGLDLTRPLPPSAERCAAALRLTACMAWPDDQARRREFLATKGAQAVRAAKEPPPAVALAGAQPPAAAGLQASLDAFPGEFQPQALAAGEADAPGMGTVMELVSGNAPGWYVAGSVLYLVRTMAMYHRDMPGGPSVGKAITMLERFPAGADMPQDRKALRAAWRRFRPVAHLCAAFVSLITEIRHQPEERQDALAAGLFSAWLGVLLSLGREFQTFATGYRMPGRNAPLLAAGGIWAVPRSLTLPRTRVRTAPISGARLAEC